jgi:hypothetical protein
VTTATQPQPYSPASVPPTGDERSRFMLPSGPNGANSAPAQTAVVCYQTILQQRVGESERVNRNKIVALRKIAQAEGEYVLIPAGSLAVVQTHASRFGDGKLGRKVSETGGAFLDAILLDAERFDNARESEVYEAARLMAEQGQFIGRDLLNLNRILTRIVLTKHGAPEAGLDL